MSDIHFFNEDTAYVLKHKTKVRQWIADAIHENGFKLDELNFIFCSDAYLLAINQNYLEHDDYTDVITFDNSEGLKTVFGDIFISIDRIKENARTFHSTTFDELCRVMIHGTLHLLGYKDKSVAEKKRMTGKEDEFLKKRTFQF